MRCLNFFGRTRAEHPIAQDNKTGRPHYSSGVSKALPDSIDLA